MQTIILVLHVLAALSVIALVLVQQGKGSDIGAAFGSGASNTMFGSAGSTSFLMKVTMILAGIFFCTSLGLDFLSAHHPSKTSTNILNLPTTSTQIVIPNINVPHAGPAYSVAPQKQAATPVQQKVSHTVKTTNQE
jgi:preprotein translocase subunit SecG